MDWAVGQGPTLTGHTAPSPGRTISASLHLCGENVEQRFGDGASASALEPQSQRWVPSHLWVYMGHDVERKQVEGSPWSQALLLEAPQPMPYYSGAEPPPQTSGKACPAQTWGLMMPMSRAEDG